jgi:DNA-binding NtrC family response regulator
MMTAYCQEMADLVEDALKNSAYACLYKPLDMTKVLALVDKIREMKQKANGNLQKEVRGDGGEKKNLDH